MSTVKRPQEQYARPSVLEVGAGASPDPRATTTADLHDLGCDLQFDIRDDWPVDDDSVSGIIARHVLEHVEFDEYEHVFNEAARVLVPGGWMEVHVPVGADQPTDGSHKTEWSWRFPDRSLCDADASWLPTVPFTLVEKRLDVWMCGPAWPLTPLVRRGARLAPFEGWYELPGATGELTVIFREVGDGR